MKVGDNIKPKNLFKDQYIGGYIAEYVNGSDDFLIYWSDNTSSWISRGKLFEDFELDKDGKFAIILI